MKTENDKINHISMTVKGMISEHKHKDMDLESFIGDISSILCEIDTDLAIKVMGKLGDIGEYQSLAIKVNYGY